MNSVSSTIRRDDYVSDITVDIGLALQAQLEAQYPNRMRAPRRRDNPLCIAPGHSIFIRHGEFNADEAARSILPALDRDLSDQLSAAGVDRASDDWTFVYAWDGHGLFQDGQFVELGFRFEAYVQIRDDR